MCVCAVGSSFEIGKTGTNKKGQPEMRGSEPKLRFNLGPSCVCGQYKLRDFPVK